MDVEADRLANSDALEEGKGTTQTKRRTDRHSNGSDVVYSDVQTRSCISLTGWYYPRNVCVCAYVCVCACVCVRV